MCKQKEQTKIYAFEQKKAYVTALLIREGDVTWDGNWAIALVDELLLCLCYFMLSIVCKWRQAIP